MNKLDTTLKKNLKGYISISPELVGREEYLSSTIFEEVKDAVLKYRTYIMAREEQEDLKFFDEIFGDFEK